MQQDGKNERASDWMTRILTDVHFWVPVVVLVGGLLLLRFVH